MKEKKRETEGKKEALQENSDDITNSSLDVARRVGASQVSSAKPLREMYRVGWTARYFPRAKLQYLLSPAVRVNYRL